MKIEQYKFNHWNSRYPMFVCSTLKDYQEITKWMRTNSVQHFLWSSGGGGYIFDVRDNAEWFVLRWL